MCLATVYKESDDSVIFKNVSRIDVDGNKLVLRDIMGDERVVEGSQKLSISKPRIENKNQACYSSGTQINSSICNVSIFINSFTSSPDIRALIKNENHRKQINTCLIKNVVHIY